MNWFNSTGPRKYYVDFIVYPLIVATIAALTLRGWAWPLWFASGFSAWTFVEYWVHRSLLHGLMWEGTHERHHTNPKEFVDLPGWYTAGTFGLLFAAMTLTIAPWAMWPLFAGFVGGYCWFLLMHHWLHHIELTGKPAFLQGYAIWHNRHHKLTDMNYGITTPLWDWMFKTSH